MIYSAAVDGWPDTAKAAVYARLREVLFGNDREERYQRLTPGDRRAIIEILRETKPNCPGISISRKRLGQHHFNVKAWLQTETTGGGGSTDH